jgi:hypothetical protein
VVLEEFVEVTTVVHIVICCPLVFRSNISVDRLIPMFPRNPLSG